MQSPALNFKLGQTIALALQKKLATSVHVNRVLHDLRTDRILDPDKLVDVAGIDPQLAFSWTRSPFA